jgi:hypothetical protein
VCSYQAARNKPDPAKIGLFYGVAGEVTEGPLDKKHEAQITSQLIHDN